MTLLLTADPAVTQTVALGFASAPEVVATAAEARRRIDEQSGTDLLVIGPDIAVDDALALSRSETSSRPELGVVLIRRRLDTGVLTQALRCGVRDVVPTDDLPALSEACRRSLEVTNRVRGLGGSAPMGAPNRPLGRVVTVFSAKGGCGKTTLATNLAAALADKERVCLVDLDLDFGDVGIVLQLTPTRGMADAAGLAGRLDETAVRSLLTPYRDRFETVLAPVKPGLGESLPPAVVGELLDVARTMFDVVIVDTAPVFSEHVLTAFDRSDHFLLVSTLDVPSLKDLKLAMEMLQMLHYPTERAHVVLNRADSRVGLSARDAEAALGVPLAAELPSSRVVPASINRGVPVVSDQPRHPVSKAIRRLAAQYLMAPAATGSVREVALTAADRRQSRHAALTGEGA